MSPALEFYYQIPLFKQHERKDAQQQACVQAQLAKLHHTTHEKSLVSLYSMLAL
jgi:hypothetical protein